MFYSNLIGLLTRVLTPKSFSFLVNIPRAARKFTDHLSKTIPYIIFLNELKIVSTDYVIHLQLLTSFYLLKT